MDKLLTLQPQWLWLSFAVLLGVAEMLVPGFFLIWIGAAALVTGVAALFGAPVTLQLALFAILSVVAVYAGKRWFSVNPINSDDPMLNDRAARMVGQVGTAAEPVDANGGRVSLGDSVWPARAASHIASGARVRVIALHSGTLNVEAAD
jgi:inner membrane protein